MIMPVESFSVASSLSVSHKATIWLGKEGRKEKKNTYDVNFEILTHTGHDAQPVLTFSVLLQDSDWNDLIKPSLNFRRVSFPDFSALSNISFVSVVMDIKTLPASGSILQILPVSEKEEVSSPFLFLDFCII